MKTVLVNYTGRTAGGPVHAYEMTKALAENGAKVIAILSRQIENLAEWQKLPVDLILINTYTNKREFIFRTLQFVFYERYCLRKKLTGVKIDAIYVPMCTYWSYFISSIFSDVPVYYTIHDPIPHSGEHLLNRIYQIIYKYEARKAYKIIVLSKRFEQAVANLYQRKLTDILYIPQGAFFSYKENASSSIKLVNYADDKINFLFFGRIEKYKGLDILFRAYEALEQNYGEKVSLTIAGKGNLACYESYIRKLHHVKLLNYLIPEEYISSLFDGNKVITVLPYIDATQSGVVNTAYMFNSLVMASDTGALSEQLGNGKYGILFPSNDIKALEKVMVEVVNNYDFFQNKINTARQHVESLRWKKLGCKLLSHIN